MNTTFVDTRTGGQASAFGGAIDAIGGIAAAVIAIIGLAGFHPATMTAISVIVFGAAMLIQGGTLLSEYAVVMQVVPSAAEGESDGGMSVMFLAGVTGIVLGILALLGIAARPLTAVAILAFGAALTLSSTSVRRLFLLQAAARRVSSRSGTEMLAGEMASGSAGVQLLAGLTAIVLGILSAAGARPEILMLAALIVLGVTLIMTGSTLSGMVMSFMRQGRTTS